MDTIRYRALIASFFFVPHNEKGESRVPPPVQSFIMVWTQTRARDLLRPILTPPPPSPPVVCIETNELTKQGSKWILHSHSGTLEPIYAVDTIHYIVRYLHPNKIRYERYLLLFFAGTLLSTNANTMRIARPPLWQWWSSLLTRLRTRVVQQRMDGRGFYNVLCLCSCVCMYECECECVCVCVWGLSRPKMYLNQ